LALLLLLLVVLIDCLWPAVLSGAAANRDKFLAASSWASRLVALLSLLLMAVRLTVALWSTLEMFFNEPSSFATLWKENFLAKKGDKRFSFTQEKCSVAYYFLKI
jgi:hypothetical protein